MVDNTTASKRFALNRFVAIVIITGLAAMVIVFALCVYCCCIKKKRKRSRSLGPQASMESSYTGSMDLSGSASSVPMLSIVRRGDRPVYMVSEVEESTQSKREKPIRRVKTTRTTPTLGPSSVPRRVPDTLPSSSWVARKKSPQEVSSKELKKLPDKKKDLRVVSSISRMKTYEITDIYKLDSSKPSSPKSMALQLGYVIHERIGTGSYAIVYKATCMKHNVVYACKVIDLTAAAKHNTALKSELFTMERAHHPHIIKLHTHFIIKTREARTLYIFMQYAPGESLSVYMRKVRRGQSEFRSKKWFAQILSALAHMHNLGIAHRDLKMGNILLDGKHNCLVTDFGLSRIAYRKSLGGIVLSHKYCGTVPYMAPEVLINRHYQVDYDPFLADVWALGVVLYCIINRGYPFSEGADMYEQQMSHGIKMSRRMIFPETKELRILFQSILHADVSKRASVDELLNTPWCKAEIDKVEAHAAEMAPGKKEVLSAIGSKTQASKRIGKSSAPLALFSSPLTDKPSGRISQKKMAHKVTKTVNLKPASPVKKATKQSSGKRAEKWAIKAYISFQFTPRGGGASLKKAASPFVKRIIIPIAMEHKKDK